MMPWLKTNIIGTRMKPRTTTSSTMCAREPASQSSALEEWWIAWKRHMNVNIGEWLPVTATFSACLQNNHHHFPGFLRLSHHGSEYDFGFEIVKVMKAFGLVQATARGAEIPREVALTCLNF